MSNQITDPVLESEELSGTKNKPKPIPTNNDATPVVLVLENASSDAA
jgi:hypothetical protein